MNASGDSKLFWVHRNQQRRDRAMPAGRAVEQVAVQANDLDAQRTSEAAAALAEIVDDDFRVQCRVRCKGATLNIFVDNPGEVDVLRRTWHLDIQSLLRSAVHGVSRVRFAHGRDGFEIPTRTGGSR